MKNLFEIEIRRINQVFFYLLAFSYNLIVLNALIPSFILHRYDLYFDYLNILMLSIIGILWPPASILYYYLLRQLCKNDLDWQDKRLRLNIALSLIPLILFAALMNSN